MTTIRGENVSANDLSEVVLLNTNTNVSKSSHLTPADLQFQEERRQRKVRKLNFEER